MLDMVGRENTPRIYHWVSNLVHTIMCSANVRIRKARYLLFGDGAGDHRILLLDLDDIFFWCKSVPECEGACYAP